MTESLKEKVYKTIKMMILNNEINEGEFIREAQISEKLGVSRTPVREAIYALENEDLVKTYRNKGTVVTTLSTQTIKELFQARHLIEPISLRLSFPFLSHTKLEEFKTAFNSNIESKDFNTLHLLDYDFHNYINSVCHNQYLINALERISDDFQRVRTQDFYTEERTIGGAKEHLEIIDYIIGDNLEKALTALENHISMTEQYYFKSLI